MYHNCCLENSTSMICLRWWRLPTYFPLHSSRRTPETPTRVPPPPPVHLSLTQRGFGTPQDSPTERACQVGEKIREETYCGTSSSGSIKEPGCAHGSRTTGEDASRITHPREGEELCLSNSISTALPFIRYTSRSINSSC